MLSFTITGLIILAIYSSRFLVNNITHTPLLIVVYPKWAKFLSLSVSVLAVTAAYQIHTSSRAVQSCSHRLHTCGHDLNVTILNNTVLVTKLENRPMKGVAALRAELSKCEMEKSGLRWFRDDCRAHCEEHGRDVPWDIGMKIDGMFGQMREVALTGGEEDEKDGKVG